MLFQVAAEHTAILTDLIFLGLRQRKVGDIVIANLRICAAHFFKNRLHFHAPFVLKCQQLCGFFSFPTTARPIHHK